MQTKKKIDSVKRKTKPYLTKRILQRAARAGLREAAAETMALMGFNVVAENGWVVKKFASGRIERIKPIQTANLPGGILLD